MSLEATLSQAVADGKLRQSSLANINSLLAASTNPLYRSAIEELANDSQWRELDDRFYQTLKFGTGGLRGRTIGRVIAKAEQGSAEAGRRPDHPCVGTNSMNFFNVLRATRGLVAYILKYRAAAGLSGKASLVIAHDTRHYSKQFCDFAAKVATDMGADVYVWESCRPTPEMSFAVRTLRADSGVMITASHNPPHDNGYKVNFNDGAGIVEPHAKGIITEVNAITSESYEPVAENERGKVIVLGKDMDEAFLTRVKTSMLRPELLEKAQGLKIVYTALHGTGGVFVPGLLRGLGFNVNTVPEQDVQDGHFPPLNHRIQRTHPP